MKNKKKFKEIMAAMAEVFDKQITDALLSVYWKCLGPFDDERVLKALNRAIVSYKWFPKPVEIIDLLKEDVKALSAPEAWGQVMDGLEYGKIPEDPIIQKAIKAVGGWDSLSLATYKELHWIEKQFNEHYSAYQEREVDLLIEGEERKLLRLVEGKN